MNKTNKDCTQVVGMQSQTPDEVTGLTPTQEKVAVMLAIGENIKDVANKVGVSRGTIYLWQNKQEFQCYYNRQCVESRESLRNGLLSLRDEALSVIKRALLSDKESTALKVAMWVVDKGLSEEKEKRPVEIRDVLKALYTTKRISGANDPYFNSEAYQRALQEKGLLPDL